MLEVSYVGRAKIFNVMLLYWFTKYLIKDSEFTKNLLFLGILEFFQEPISYFADVVVLT